ncbi:hypothetical protein D9M68_533990 [compost metagenome]
MHVLAQLGVEVRHRLVEQQHLGTDRQPPGDGHALTLAARQLFRKALAKAAQAHQFQCLVDPAGALRRRHAPHLQPEADIAGHGHVRKQRIALEHHAHAALFRAQRGDIAPVEHDATARGLDKAGDHLQRGGLAAARRAEQRQEFAAPDVQAQVFDGMKAAIGFREVAQCKEAHVFLWGSRRGVVVRLPG